MAEQVASLMERRREAEDRDGEEVSDEPSLGTLYSASIRGRIATVPNAGKRVRTLGQHIGAEDFGEEESFQPGTSRCAAVSGFSVHAGVSIRAHDRKGLERLCRYTARPPVATERLARRTDGRLSYRLKTPWRDGTTHVIFEPQELLEKLAVLVPAPRLNLTRFHGILAPAAKWRASVVPAPAAATPSEPPCDCEHGADAKTLRRNYPWVSLMARVFEVDVLECPDVFGSLRPSILRRTRDRFSIALTFRRVPRLSSPQQPSPTKISIEPCAGFPRLQNRQNFKTWATSASRPGRFTANVEKLPR